MKKDVVVGVVRTYSYDKIKPFIKTLKQCFDGDIVLFCNEISKNTMNRLNNDGVIVKEFYIKTHEHLLVDKIQKTDFLKLPLMSYRFVLYRDFLIKNKDKYNNILLTDVGDVIFQKNPFDFDVGDFVYFFLTGRKISEDSSYVSWIKRTYGKDIYGKMEDEKISCAGTIIAPIKEMINYLNEMIKEIFNGNDQCIHNYLCYSGILKKIKLFTNGNIVATITSKEDLENFNIKYKLYNNKNEIVNIVHGYNRHKKLADFFDGNHINPFINKIKKHSKLIFILHVLKKMLYKTPFIGKYVKYIYINSSN